MNDFKNEELEFNRKYNQERVDTQYFIDLKGKIHRYKGSIDEDITSMHYRIAKQAFPELEYPEDHVKKLGWILVGSTVYHTPIIHKKPTQAQINTLYDLKLYSMLCFAHKGYYENYEKYQILCD